MDGFSAAFGGGPILPLLAALSPNSRDSQMARRPFSSANDGLHEGLSAKSRAARKSDKDLATMQRRLDRLPRRNDLRPQLDRVEMPIDQLFPPTRDVREHSQAHIAELAASVSVYGLVGDIVANPQGRILNGVALFLAARQLGMKTVPCIVASHMSPAAEEGFRIAVNRLGERGGWNLDTLVEIANELVEVGEPILGFDDPELDILLSGEVEDEPNDDVDDVFEPDADAVTRPGWLWQAGPHRIGCLDAIQKDSYVVLMGRKKARLVFTDVPYNVPIAGHVSGLGAKIHREFVCASGEMSDDEFAGFLTAFLQAAKGHVVDGGLIGSFIDWRGVGALLNAGLTAQLTLLNIIVWAKSNAGMGSLWRSAHEMLPIFKVGTAAHINNVELGRHGRTRTNVWQYAGASTMGSDAREGLKFHPTVKNLRMIQEGILDVTERGDIVLDPFLGSGTTLLAAEQSRRVAYGMELDPLYVDVAIRRWQALTGKQAILSHTGQTFDEVATHGPGQLALPAPQRQRPRPDQIVDLRGGPDND